MKFLLYNSLKPKVISKQNLKEKFFNDFHFAIIRKYIGLLSQWAIETLKQ